MAAPSLRHSWLWIRYPTNPTYSTNPTNPVALLTLLTLLTLLALLTLLILQTLLILLIHLSLLTLHEYYTHTGAISDPFASEESRKEEDGDEARPC
jgi:hypothetical protein